MAEQFDAGSVFVQFKAVAQQVVDAANKAGQSVKRFGDEANRQGERINKAGSKITSTFSSFDKAGASLIGRASSMAQRLIGVQLALQTVVGTTGEASRGLRVAAQSFSAFAAIVSVFPTPLGLAAGAAAALVIALKGMLGPSDEAKKALEAQKKAAEDAKKAYEDLASQMAAFNVAVVKERGVGLGLVEQAIKREERQLAIYEAALLEQEKKLLIMFKGVRGETGAAPVSQKEYEAQLKLVESLRSSVTEQVRGIELRKLAIAEADKEFAAKKAAIEEEKKREKELFDLEIQQIKNNAELKKKADAEIAAGEEEYQRQADEDAYRRRQEAIAAAEELAEAEKRYVDEVATYEFLRRQENEQKRIAEIEKLTQEFKDRFAGPFAYSVSAALQEGIMSGMSALDALKNFGEKIFSDMVGGFAKDLQTTLTDTISKIAGAAGDTLGGVISGLVGVAGFFLSGRGSKGGKQTFGDVGGVTSTQAVRGVVAGPTSIAISAVGDNLSRSMIPIIERMDTIIAIMKGFPAGGRSTGGSSYAGAVPTS